MVSCVVHFGGDYGEIGAVVLQQGNQSVDIIVGPHGRLVTVGPALSNFFILGVGELFESDGIDEGGDG